MQDLLEKTWAGRSKQPRLGGVHGPSGLHQGPLGRLFLVILARLLHKRYNFISLDFSSRQRRRLIRREEVISIYGSDIRIKYTDSLRCPFISSKRCTSWLDVLTCRTRLASVSSCYPPPITRFSQSRLRYGVC